MILIFLTWIAVNLARPTLAADFSFHLFGPESGLSDTSGQCLVADRSGFLYACSFDGVYAFDGRTFSKVDAQQDHRRRFLASNIVLTTSGRLVIQYSDRLSIADEPATLARPPSSLHFTSIPLSMKQAAYTKNLALWRDGVAMLDGTSIIDISVPSSGPAVVRTFPLPDIIRRLPPASFEALYSVGDDLWILRSTGEACLIGRVSRCDGEAAGLPREHWIAMTRARDGSLLLRSARLVAHLPRGGRTWSVETLPDQGIAYGNYLERLAFFQMPDGETATQADDGLAVLRGGHWQVLTNADGIPKGIISAGLAQGHSLWLQMFGSGVERSSTLNRWQSITHADGLSAGNAWETTRLDDGSVWVAVDTGLNRISTGDGPLRIDKVLPGAGYALSASNGLLWGSNGEWGGLRIVDPSSLASRVVHMGSVVALARGAGATMWVATPQGLYSCNGTALDQVSCVRETTGFVSDIIPDGAGGIYYLGSADLRHRLVTGEDDTVVAHWPNQNFKSTVLTRSGSTFWIGGEDGFYRVGLHSGLPPSIEPVPPIDLGGDQTIAAVLVDHRGWLWVSTEANLTVFNGDRWISLSTEDGMLSDDLDQRGLREDPDGSIWVTSSAGVMHLLSPETVYSSQKLNVSISHAKFGTDAVLGTQLPFSRKPLTIDLGTPGYTAEKAVTFRYRMSGVDDDWVETSGSTVFYPFVPPGRHVFTVVATDRLKHLVSPPQTLLIAVEYPWWRQWWSESLWVAAAAMLLYGGVRLRIRVERSRQAELERRVEEVTAEIRQAQAALAHQATHDQLTGMLNRSAVESRLAGLLIEREEARDIVIGLVDIDHFKAINDGWGHLTGDQVLREMGALGLGMLRAEEFAGRYGGEEILLVLRNGDGRAVTRLAEFHHRVRSHHFSKAGSPGLLSVTCSVGLAAVFAGDSWESLIDRADRALYHAKRSGRDRIAGLAGSAPTLEADFMLERVQRSSDAS